MRIRIFTIVWGQHHLDWFRRACLQSLAWPRNRAAINQHVASWDIYGDLAEAGEIVRLTDEAKRLGLAVPVNFFDRQGSDFHSCVKKHFKVCLDDKAALFLAPPDTIFGDGSVETIFACGQPKGVCVAVPHVRVDSETWPFSPAPLPNDKLVTMAFQHLHPTWKDADATQAKTNTFIGGVSWRRLGPSLWAVQHMLPTYYLVNVLPGDLADSFPGFWWDHSGFPEKLVNEQRQRTIASSDGAFIVELTEPNNNIPQVGRADVNEPDEFTRDYPHNRVNRNVLSIFRGTEAV